MKKIFLNIVLLLALFIRIVYAMSISNGEYVLFERYSLYLGFIVILTIFIITVRQKNELYKKSLTITKEKEKVTYLAYYDQLTNLKNRASFYKKVKELIEEKKRFVLFFLDIDDFKSINDIYGHQEGDQFLIKIALELKKSFHEEEIFRLGGDEFTLIMTDFSESIENIAGNIISALRKPMIHNDIKACVTASVGISIYPNHGKNVGELLKNADIAMYKSKELGKNRYYIYTEELGEKVREREEIKDLLQVATDDLKQIKMHYQPVYNINGGIVGFESLIRWERPNIGIIYPVGFIRLAETTGIIHKLGLSAVEKTFYDINKYNIGFCVSINISTLQLLNNNFVDNIINLINKYNIDTSKIIFEVTETAKLYDIQKTIEILMKIRKLGIRLALDDFGVGYTSIGYLLKLPLDFIKIDRSLVNQIGVNKRTEQILKDIMKLANNSKIRVIAEGVESDKQLEFLSKANCGFIQGYLKSKPVPWREVVKV